MSDYHAPPRFAHVRPVAPSGAARPAGRTLADALRDPAVVLQVTVAWDRADRPVWTVSAWTGRFEPIALDPVTRERLFTQWRERYPAIDWWRPHQVDLRTGAVGSAPGLGDDGYIPQDDLSFGTPRPPILADHQTPPLPFAAPEPARRAA